MYQAPARPPSQLCSLSRAPRGERFPAFPHPQGWPKAEWCVWSPRGAVGAPAGKGRSPHGGSLAGEGRAAWGKMKTESWADTG